MFTSFDSLPTRNPVVPFDQLLSTIDDEGFRRRGHGCESILFDGRRRSRTASRLPTPGLCYARLEITNRGEDKFIYQRNPASNGTLASSHSGVFSHHYLGQTAVQIPQTALGILKVLFLFHSCILALPIALHVPSETIIAFNAFAGPLLSSACNDRRNLSIGGPQRSSMSVNFPIEPRSNGA